LDQHVLVLLLVSCDHPNPATQQLIFQSGFLPQEEDGTPAKYKLEQYTLADGTPDQGKW